MARLLLEKGAYPKARTREGRTPLHLAVSCGHIEVVRLLLEAKADVNARDSIEYRGFYPTS